MKRMCMPIGYGLAMSSGVKVRTWRTFANTFALLCVEEISATTDEEKQSFILDYSLTTKTNPNTQNISPRIFRRDK